MKSCLNLRKKLISIILLIAILFGFCSCGQTSNSPVTKTGIYFDTVISITLYGDDAKYIEDCFNIAAKYESYFSNTIKDSDISRINATHNQFVSVHDETIELLETGIEYYDLTNHAFDITIGALSNAWDFDEQIKSNTKSIPDNDEITKAISTLGADNIVIDGNTVCLKGEDNIIDLGGIAKGYIADKMKEYLNDKGVNSGMINLGGNVLTVGPKSDGSLYAIGVQKPFSDDGKVAVRVEIKDATLVTSGDYQRYFEYNGKIYHHILDTKTGYPIENDLDAVTIVTDSSCRADALSTYVFSLGLDKGLDFVNNSDDVEAIFIKKNGDIIVSNGFGNNIKYEVIN